ncbi:CCA tRNA nucleotidyltransferase [bacterium]|nr:CCA tRNA nucleotidyltransferase [Flavobacteriales bacterium]MDA9303919.1 CCA tRNA nucleotidyltransferase [bacterium]MDB4052228.1 CCA tRNA nucleotidyltransferase [Flavobacteriales bacterium]
MQETQLANQLSHPIFEVIRDAVQNERVFVIGGFVRDLLLGRPCKDIDIVIEGSGIELAEKIAEKVNATKVSVFKNFGTAMIKLKDGYEIEFVGARKESYDRNSRKPTVENGTIEDDQKRRDFRINALAISLNKATYGDLVDPFGGVTDLKNKLIKTPLEPGVTYSDDPLRMMRAIRFASQLGFNIHHTSLSAIRENKERISIISQERITSELNKIILSNVPSIGFKLLYNTGLLDIIFPEMVALYGVEFIDGKGHKDNFYHTLEVLDNIAPNTDNLWLRWAAIMHDIAKPLTKRFDKKVGWTFHSHEVVGSKMVKPVFKRMKLPLDSSMQYVRKLVFLHLRPIALTNPNTKDAAYRRMLFEAGEDIDDLLKLCRADITSKNENKVQRYLQKFDKVEERIIEIEENDRIRNWQPPISGEIIMKTFGIKPCYEVGKIKSDIKDAILEGTIKNDFDEAFEYMVSLGDKLGLKVV